MNYTPGPWETRKPRTTQNLVSHYVQSESENLAICKVLKDEYRTSEAAEANARLIATAPDLLEALETLRSAFVVAVGDKSPFAKVALNKVDEVLNKARGL